MDKSLWQILRILIIGFFLMSLIPGTILGIIYYHTGWVIGKSFDEVQERYGTFDYGAKIPEDHTGTHMAGYIIIDEYNGLLGDLEGPRYWVIYFDENNTAVKCRLRQLGDMGWQDW